MSKYLPQELEIKILQRLPINSVIRCTCVCKSWYSLITSPSFISTHLNNQQDEHILVRRFSGDPTKEKYDLFIDNENFDQYAQFDVPFKRRDILFNVVGSCNGLLCLSDKQKLESANVVIHLWNPSIRKSIKLPKPKFVSESGLFQEKEYRAPVYHMLGFGFDSVTNDYKVVRIVHAPGIGFRSHTSELYKLSTGVWKDITLIAPCDDFFPRVLAGVYVNGACHWVASKGRAAQLGSFGKSHPLIVLFDMHDEMFREVMLPASLVEKFWLEDWEFILFKSWQSLCLAHNDNQTIDIWMMQVYGDPQSWVKLFNISLCITFSVVANEFFSMLYGGSLPHEPQVTHYLFQPMVSRKNGEILWRAYHPFLVSYDLAVKKMKCLCIHSSNSRLFHGALYVNTYKESLVLLDKRTNIYGGDTCEEESSDLCNKELNSTGYLLQPTSTATRIQAGLWRPPSLY